MHPAPQRQILDQLRDSALAAFGEGAVATPAMQAALETAATAVWRVFQEPLDLWDAALDDGRPTSAAPGTAPARVPAKDATPPLPTALIDLTASQVTRAVRDRTISPVDLIEALLARARDVDGQVQAWETLDAEGALLAARAAEAQLADGSSVGLLHGVPFGVKDTFDTAGLRTAGGFAPYDRRIPNEDAVAVAALRGAGGIVLGKTVATQFAFTDPSRTHNPWSPDHTPGGSSSGSGAAVAAREVPWALGSQTAGSVLRPAAYNGVVGFKPTQGRIEARGAFPLAWSLDTVGIITRSVDDCALFLDAATGAISYALPSESELRPPRLGLVTTCLEAAEPEVRAHVKEMSARFERAGADVREVRLPSAYDLIQAVHWITMRSEMATAYWSLWTKHTADLGPILRAGIQIGSLIPGYAYLHAQRLRSRMRAALAEELANRGGLDAYLLPTATNPAPGMETTGDPSLQVPATLFGFPSMSLPSGLTTLRLPLAVQLIGSAGHDAALLEVASWCEAELGPFPSPESLTQNLE